MSASTTFSTVVTYSILALKVFGGYTLIKKEFCSHGEFGGMDIIGETVTCEVSIHQSEGHRFVEESLFEPKRSKVFDIIRSGVVEYVPRMFCGDVYLPVETNQTGICEKSHGRTRQA